MPCFGRLEKTMLDAFIIEELRRREQQERTNEQRPRLELPIERERHPRPDEPERDPRRREEDRGVVVIDL